MEIQFSSNSRYEYANDWVDDFIALQFFICFVHGNYENPIFQLWKSKTCLISTPGKKKQNNVCSDIFWYGEMLLHVWAKKKENLYTKYIDNCENMTSSTHSFAYSYRLFKMCFVENSKFHIFFIFLSELHQIFTVLFEIVIISFELP